GDAPTNAKNAAANAAKPETLLYCLGFMANLTHFQQLLRFVSKRKNVCISRTDRTVFSPHRPSHILNGLRHLLALGQLVRLLEDLAGLLCPTSDQEQIRLGDELRVIICAQFLDGFLERRTVYRDR